MFVKKLSILPLLLTMLLLPACRKTPVCGSVTVRVLDGFSDTPIEGAVVTVPETGARSVTGFGGCTEPMQLPVIPDGEYEKLLPSGSGRISLIVTAEGYTPYLLLYARVTPNEARSIEVLLFPADGTLPVFTVIEAPPQEWAEELVNKYR